VEGDGFVVWGVFDCFVECSGVVVFGYVWFFEGWVFVVVFWDVE